jgi:hypothetical protein
MKAPHALRFSSRAAFLQNAFDVLPLCLAFVQE